MTLSLENVFGLRGRTALVTGSSRGIGAAIARGLAAAGAEVAVHGRDESSPAATLETIRREGGKALPIVGDLSVSGQGAALIRNAEEMLGRLDILVVNASAQINAELPGLTEEDFHFQVNVNLRSTVEMLQTCLPKMAARGWGRVVSIGSVNQDRPKSIVTAYAATKAAQHNLIMSQARDYARKGVLLNTLAPGLVDTDRNAGRQDADPKAWADYVDAVNWMGRMATPEEMVGAAVFLASDACSFMTGETVSVNGGV